MVMPNATTVAYIKERLLAAGMAAFGVHFLTPGTLRARLLTTREKQPLLAIREDLQLLARIAAGEQAKQGVAQAVLLEPEEFVKACDALEAGGWEADGFAQADVRAMARAYRDKLQQAGLSTVYRVDRALRDAVGQAKLCFSELLIFGFTAQHWSQFNLLVAAPYFATNTLLCLPLESVSSAEIMWQSQWEQAVGTAEPLLDASQDEAAGLGLPLQRIAAAAARFERLTKPRDCDTGGEASGQGLRYWLAQDIRREAAVITEQVVQYLAAPTCERLAVVFANRVSPLAREVGERLLRLEIPHHHIPGHYPGQTPEQELFERWVAMQLTQRLQPCIQFFKTLYTQGLIAFEVLCALEKALLNAFRECMTDDLNVLLAYVSAVPTAHAQWLGQAQAWPSLPEHDSFASFFAAAVQPLVKMGWPPRMDLLQDRAGALAAVLTMPIQREAFLVWLRAVVNLPGRTRSALGREPFARVQLTTLAEAAGQTWSHVIVAGMVQGVWPPEAPSSAFLSEHDISRLNRAATVEGTQGKGHEVMAAGHSYMLAPHEQRRRDEEDFFALLGGVRQGAVLTASAVAADGSGKASALSDLWMRLYYAEHGELFGPVQQEAHISQSESFLSVGATGAAPQAVDFPAVRQAHECRRDRNVPFNEFSFCFKHPPATGIILSCKAWEAAYKRPALAWYEHVLHVRPMPAPAKHEVRALAAGTWLHDWVNPTARATQLQVLPAIDAWIERIERAADKKRVAVARAYRQAQRALPDWWQAEWAWTRRLAQQFARSITGQQLWSHGAGEFSLRPGAKVAAPGGLNMPVRGRMDLVLGQHAAVLEAHTELQRAAWIIDFKTGTDGPLSARGLAVGDGIQLALYALALHSTGVDVVDVSILGPDAVLQRQLSIDAVLEPAHVWQTLQDMHQRGCFGDRGAVRSAFGFTGQYPLATLPIDPLVLEEKWQLTRA